MSDKKLTVGLPVMLHKESEIQAFLEAKELIEKYGESIGRPLQVGAFLFFIPPAMREENLEKQKVNQAKYRLPIVHAQSTFQSRHCLAFSAEQDTEYGKDLIDLVINQVAALRSEDSSQYPVTVSVNVGLFVSRNALRMKSPVILTPDQFNSQRDALYDRCASRFSALESLAR
ncbi:hypothetical protein FJZ18_04180 [Candidatus Pacearchaeota archaeon]|nr:hypothetical protein [Candidatus Pacearchaeota archaeon]